MLMGIQVQTLKSVGGRNGHDRMVIGFTTTNDKAISLSATGWWFSPVLQFSPSIKLTDTIYMK